MSKVTAVVPPVQVSVVMEMSLAEAKQLRNLIGATSEAQYPGSYESLFVPLHDALLGVPEGAS